MGVFMTAYGIGQAIIFLPYGFFMVVLRSRCGHYIFVLFLLISSFPPRLISVVAEWMSTILLHMVCS